jgi:hypothetical protein
MAVGKQEPVIISLFRFCPSFVQGSYRGGMLEFLEDFAKIFFDLVCIPFLTEPVYLKGVLVGLVIAFVMGTTARIFLYARGKVQVFFAAVPPSLKPSPSPKERMNGCMFGVIILFLLAVITLTSMWMVAYALSRYGG